MKKSKMCYRTLSGDNFEPTNCLGSKCMAWLETKNLSGCVFVLHAATSIGRNLEEAKKAVDYGDEDNPDKKRVYNGNDDKDSTCDGQCKEGRIVNIERDRKKNDSGNSPQEDKEKKTEFVNPWPVRG